MVDLSLVVAVRRDGAPPWIAVSTDPESRLPAEEPAPSAALSLAKAAGEDSTARDRFIARASATGDSVATIADYLGLSRQQIYAILDKQRQAPPPDQDARLGPEHTSAWRETEQALEGLTSGEDLERLATILIGDVDPTARPIGGSADRARDAVADLGDGDGSIFSISIERQWPRKIRREVGRIIGFGHTPRFVYAITNQKTTRQAEDTLEQWAAEAGLSLRVLGQRWLIVKLLHPDYRDLRERMLHLPPPRPRVFRTEAEYRELLDGRPSNLGLALPRVGSDEFLQTVRERLEKNGRLVLTGAGGAGKTRLVLDLAEMAPAGETWRFLDELATVNDHAVAELGVGHELVVVIDNAHRRTDLGQVLSRLEQRRPQPRVIFVTRPHRVDALQSAARDVWLGALGDDDYLPVPRLSASDLVQLIEGPAFGLAYSELVQAIVRISEGNPLIAILAAGLARDGRSIAELSRDTVFEDYVAGVLGTLTDDAADPRQLREVLAIVAALGSLDSSDEDVLARVAGLVGFAPRAVGEWLSELADLGLLIEAHTVYSVKPDLLAEHTLASSFFTMRWRSGLSYEDVLGAFPNRLPDLAAAIGRLPQGLLDPTHAGVRALRHALLAPAARGDLATSASLIQHALPGAEDVLLTDLAALLAHIEEGHLELSGPLAKSLIDASQRLNQAAHLHLGWDLLLRVASIASDTEVLDEARKAMHSIYERVPVDASAQDGLILSVVQQAIAQATRRHARRAKTPGQRRSLAIAGQALLTVIFERTRQTVGNAREFRMGAFALPASADLETVLGVGIGALISTFAEVDDKESRRGLERATELARRVAGFSGPFGIQLTPEARAIAHEALEKLDAYLRDNLETFSLPLQAEALTYGLLRQEWFDRASEPELVNLTPPKAPARSAELAEYIALIHPGDVEPPSAHYSWDEEQRRLLAEATEIASSLAADNAWRKRLDRWRQWAAAASACYEKESLGQAPARMLAQLAELAPKRAVEVLDYLIETSSPLKGGLGVAMWRLLATETLDEPTLTRWLAHDEQTRALAATPLAEIDSEMATRLFRQLAGDESELVRRAALNGLRYGSATTEWKIRLGLEIAGDLGDLDALETVLLVAENANFALAPDLIAIARDAFLTTAHAERLRDYQLVSALQKIDPDQHDLLFDWIWARLEWLAKESKLAWTIDTLPDRLCVLVREVGTSDDLRDVLRHFSDCELDTLADEALVDLLQWLDPGADALTDFMVDNYDDPQRRRHVWRLSRLKA